jgi:hypothetical protein
VLQYRFNWKTISVAAGMTLWNFYFQLFDKAIAKQETVVFLSYLIQRISSPLLIVWVARRLPAEGYITKGTSSSSESGGLQK